MPLVLVDQLLFIYCLARVVSNAPRFSRSAPLLYIVWLGGSVMPLVLVDQLLFYILSG